MSPDDIKLGARVLYSPSLGGPKFAAVVASEPWLLGGHTWVVRLEQLGDDYCKYTSRERKSVPSAALSNLEAQPSAADERGR